jgi:hypothetical protein
VENFFGQIAGLPIVDIINGLLQVIGGASVIAKVTKTEADDRFLAKVLKLLAFWPKIKPAPKVND